VKSYQYAGPRSNELRSHPWTSSVEDPRARYYDLRADPRLIPTVLEDFVPWAHYPAITDFYALLAWINGGGSPLISNDCAFSAPDANTQVAIDRPLECSGRVMVLFRDLVRNQDPAALTEFERALHVDLATHDTHFALGAIGTSTIPVRFLEYPGAARDNLGHQILVSFWAWGHTEIDTMLQLRRVIGNLDRALRAATA
jgi:hypothetical protein